MLKWLSGIIRSAPPSSDEDNATPSSHRSSRSSPNLRSPSSVASHKQSPKRSTPTPTGPWDLPFEITNCCLVKIEGSDCNVIATDAILFMNQAGCAISTGCDEGLENQSPQSMLHVWKYSQISVVRRHNLQSIQFKVASSGSLKEYGLVTQNEEEIDVLFQVLLEGICGSCDKEMKQENASVSYSVGLGDGHKIHLIAMIIKLRERSLDNLVMLVGEWALEENVKFIAELSHEGQIWIAEDGVSFEFWGPAFVQLRSDTRKRAGLEKGVLSMAFAKEDKKECKQILDKLKSLPCLADYADIRAETSSLDRGQSWESAESSFHKETTPPPDEKNIKVEIKTEVEIKKERKDPIKKSPTKKDEVGVLWERGSSSSDEDDSDFVPSSASSSSESSDSDSSSSSSEEKRRRQQRQQNGTRRRKRVVNCIDPSEQLLCQDPSATVHQFMEIGRRQAGGTFVGRASGVERRIHGTSIRPKKFELCVYTGLSQKHSDKPNAVISDDKFQNADGDALKPSAALLHSGESKMMLLDPSMSNKLHMMDLEREKVVQTWDTAGVPVSQMHETFKGASLTGDPTVFCTNPRAMFLMDTRLKGRARVTTREYATNVSFTSAATDGSGHVLIGNSCGELRLYDGEENASGEYKIAKNVIRCDNEPIKSVEVTKDGAWIVATMRSKLAVLPAKMAGDYRSGFTNRLLMGDRPEPMCLRLRKADIVKHGLTNIDFTPAVFDETETCILTSTGSIAIVWDLFKIKKGNTEYKLKLAPSYIKGLKPTENSAVVVAYPKEVDVFATKINR